MLNYLKQGITYTLLVILWGAFVWAPQKETLSTQDSTGWINLFDGETLNGWIQKNGTGTYRVENGVIIGKTAKGSPNSFLCTVQKFGDFELEFDVKLFDDELNSGVQIRSQTRKPEGDQEYGRVNGPQIEIESSSSNTPEAGNVYEEANRGWLSADQERKQHQSFKDGEWNHYRVVAEGPRIQVWINGDKISDVWHEESYMDYPRGFIGLQVHSVGKNAGPYEVAWKNIRIKPS